MKDRLSLTRASISTHELPAFWQYVPGGIGKCNMEEFVFPDLDEDSGSTNDPPQKTGFHASGEDDGVKTVSPLWYMSDGVAQSRETEAAYLHALLAQRRFAEASLTAKVLLKDQPRSRPLQDAQARALFHNGQYSEAGSVLEAMVCVTSFRPTNLSTKACPSSPGLLGIGDAGLLPCCFRRPGRSV